MLGTSQRQPGADYTSARTVALALAGAAVLRGSLESTPALAYLGAVGFLLLALLLRSERFLLLFAAVVLVQGGWLMQQHLQDRVTQPQVRQSDALHILSVRPAQGDRPARLRVHDTTQGQVYLLNAWDAPWVPVAGDCVSAELRLRPPGGARNFHGFDYARWLYAEGIVATGSIRHLRLCASAVARVAPGPLDALAPGTGRALLRALLLADRAEFTPEIWSTLARTGTAHLFAISGLHVGLVAAMAGGLGYGLWMASAWLRVRTPRKRFAALAAFCGVLAYLGVAGGQVSAQRAGFSALLVLALLLSGRRIAPLQVWAWALLVVLLWNPFALLGPALGLSFAATALLLLLLPRLRGRGAVVSLLLIQLVLGLGMAPLVAAYFGQWSVAGLLLNLLLVPALAVVLPLCLLAYLVGLAWAVPLQLCAELLQFTFVGLEAVARWPGAALPSSAISEPEALLLLFVFAAVVRAVTRCGLTGSAGVWLLGLALLSRAPEPPSWGEARLTMLDVGQGQAIVVQTAGHWLLIDAGPRSPRGSFDAGAMVVVPHLQAAAARRVDLLVVTHGDNDHAGGVAAVVEAFPVRQRWGFGGEDCESGLRWEQDGVRVRSVKTGRQSGWSDNDRSCVVELRVGERRVLLTADMEARAEQGFLETPRGSYDVVSVPHHGSRSSSGTDFVRRLKPELALVSAGRRNRWGFPAPEVRRRWRDAGAVLLSTATAGAIQIQLPQMQVRRPPERPWDLPESVD